MTLSVAAVVVGIDQATKAWAVRRLPQGSIHIVWKLDLILTDNTGSAFSLAQGWGTAIAIMAVVLVAVLLVAAYRSHSDAMTVALGLIVGGALGNLVDRFARSHHGVVDFIALHFWPTFNVADASIVIGAALAAIVMWRSSSAQRVGADEPAGDRGLPG